MKWNKRFGKIKDRRAREKESTQRSDEKKKAKRKIKTGGKEPRTEQRVMQ